MTLGECLKNTAKKIFCSWHLFYGLDVDRCCGFINFTDKKYGIVLLGLLQGFLTIWSVVFGVLAAVVEQISTNPEASAAAKEAAENGDSQVSQVYQAMLAFNGSADTASGMYTRTGFGYPFFDFAIGFAVTCTTFAARYWKTNEGQQWLALWSSVLYVLLFLANYVAFTLSIAYAAGCQIGDKKCVAVGGCTSMFYLVCGPLRLHFAFVLNHFREYLGGRKMQYILFGEDKPSGGNMMGKQNRNDGNNRQPIGKQQEMANLSTPAPSRHQPSLAVPLDDGASVFSTTHSMNGNRGIAPQQGRNSSLSNAMAHGMSSSLSGFTPSNVRSQHDFDPHVRRADQNHQGHMETIHEYQHNTNPLDQSIVHPISPMANMDSFPASKSELVSHTPVTKQADPTLTEPVQFEFNNQRFIISSANNAKTGPGTVILDNSSNIPTRESTDPNTIGLQMI